MATPVLSFYTSAGVTLTALSFGTIVSGTETSESELWLWNNKGGVISADTATAILLNVLDSQNSQNSDFIKGGWVLARSSGLSNPSFADGFFDDNQSQSTPLSNVSSLALGDIPNNSGRRVFVKVRVPNTAPTQAGLTIQLTAGFGVNSTPLPYFFSRAFGDGVVQEVYKQVFPAILQLKAGTWSSLGTIVGGAYTGTANKRYFVKVTTGGAPGVAQYQCSDTEELSYSSSILSGTNSFTNVNTSTGLNEGVQIAFVTADQPLTVGDKWVVNVETRPFQFIPGATNSLTGYVGGGNALIVNNRVLFQRPTALTLTASTTTFIFLGADGTMTQTTGPSPANAVQSNRLLIGRFVTDTVKVTDATTLFPYVALGLDAYDDFAVVPTETSGRVFGFFQGRFKKFNRSVYLPSRTTFIGTLSLTAGITNYIEIDPLAEVVKTSPGTTNGFDVDAIPLWEVGVDTNYITSIIDRRSRVGLAAPSLKQLASLTTSSILPNATTDFDLNSFVNRALVRKLTVTATASGATITLYNDAAKSSMEYQAGMIPNPYTDNFPWFHEDSGGNSELHGRIANAGVTQTFTFDFSLERFA